MTRSTNDHRSKGSKVKKLKCFEVYKGLKIPKFKMPKEPYILFHHTIHKLLVVLWNHYSDERDIGLRNAYEFNTNEWICVAQNQGQDQNGFQI